MAKNLKSSSKIYPRLRMIANGSNEVNEVRALINKCVIARKSKVSTETEKIIANQSIENLALAGKGIPSMNQAIGSKAKVKKTLKKGKLHTDPPIDVEMNIFVRLKNNSNWKDVLEEIYPKAKKVTIKQKIKHVRESGDLVKATIVIDEINKLKESRHILSVEGSQAVLTPPKTRFTFSSTVKKPIPRFHVQDPKILKNTDNVIIGVIDVGGFDYAHPDFLDKDKKTRFEAIWDQGGINRLSPAQSFIDGQNKQLKAFADLDYGSYIDKSMMNDAIQNAQAVHVPVYAIEPQSQEHSSSHATHVASIAAGNSGICPKAMIVGVLISTQEEDERRTSTFTDSTRISDAVDFLLNFAEKEKKPISINISLGTNGHAHDGSSGVNRWIDARLTKEGRCVCVATGNSGQEKGLNDEDFGYIMGRIHTSGRIANRGLMTDLEWHVVGNGLVDLSENELEIWYEPQDRFSVMVKPPGMDWIGPVGPQQLIENRQLQDLSFISIYNNIYNAANGSNYIGVYISPNLNKENVIGVTAGLWKVRLIGDEIRDGRFDAWIERDDPVRRAQNFWNFPSFFSERTNVDNKSINSLACGQNVIAVGNFDKKNDRINISSSQGPTRDNRNKPEIVAPGTKIVAANGFAGPDDLWTEMTGTSMASPYACGVAALLLSKHPDLTSAQIAGIMKRTSLPIVDQNYEWTNDTGFGLLDVEATLQEGNNFVNYADITKTKIII